VYKNIFFQKKEEQCKSLLSLNFFKNLIYFNLVGLPQGVLGHLTDLVRPPCG
jgi:hypothetical protein